MFHTAFDDPTTPPAAPPRRSVEARAVAIWPRGPAPRAPVFFDLSYSNNAARIRIWLALKGLPAGAVETRHISYADLQTPEYAQVRLAHTTHMLRFTSSSMYDHLSFHVTT